MAKDVDLNSKRWLDLVFEGKNKDFGAYELREGSSRRHILAIAVVIIGVLALVFLPKLIKQPAAPPLAPVLQQQAVELINIDEPIALKMPARAVEVQVPATPTPVQRTIGYTEPVIVVDTDVRPEDLMLTQTELTDSDAAIGKTTRLEGETVGQHPDDKPAVNTTPVQESGPLLTAEVWPAFKGDLMKWLGSNLRYPVDAVESGQEGRVVLRFVVQADGSIGNVEILQKFFPSCDREAVRVVSKMPKWNPGSQGGRPVAVYYTLPIHFKLQK